MKLSLAQALKRGLLDQFIEEAPKGLRTDQGCFDGLLGDMLHGEPPDKPKPEPKKEKPAK